MMRSGFPKTAVVVSPSFKFSLRLGLRERSLRILYGVDAMRLQSCSLPVNQT
jgi:hypothetical protein